MAVASPGAMAAGVMSLLWSPALGGRQQIHSIVGADGTIKNYPDSLEGTVTIDGTEISVIATGVDANGYPTGFVPATQADAQKLEDLGVNVSRDSGVIDTAPLRNEEVDPDEEATRSPATGNAELNEVLEGSVPDVNGGNKGWNTPQTKEEFEDNLRDIPGAKVDTHDGPGVRATLPDGTKVSTYPARTSTGESGFQVISPEGKVIHKGSLVGQN